MRMAREARYFWGVRIKIVYEMESCYCDILRVLKTMERRSIFGIMISKIKIRNARFFLALSERRLTNYCKGLLTPNKLSYEKLWEAIKNHYVSKPSMIVQRNKFNTRVRGNNETISTFMAEYREGY